ncbi:hypothetical protein CE91St1_05740 [Parabacteroides goldsteinii]|nr:SUMF1/EgtB/PvdO family nonheme iron enzyme [Parabacteroides goldsteinii]GKG71431.1 hypothetical protein CE91St1_05740 [Parabacteroides goldsteinii]GKG77384.1 hypothetical protein CE91St2_05760 [Parabacteroides goldsteinii]
MQRLYINRKFNNNNIDNMRSLFVSSILLFLNIILFSCEKEPIPSDPIAINNIKSSSINYTSSIIQFSLTGNANKAGVMYGTEKGLSNAQIQYAEKANGEISVSLNGLEQGKEYFYKVFAEDKKGNQMFGEIKNFITLSPSVKTGDATGITTETAILSLSFEGTNLSEVGILYSTDELCKDNLQTVSNISPSGNNFSFEVKELDSGTTYYYKAYAKYKNGTIHYGEIKSFQTNEQYLKVSTTTIKAPAEGGTFQFEIEAKNIDWEISCDQDWCTIDIQSGNDNKGINILVQENVLGSKRYANIKIQYLDKIESITLEQAENLNPEGQFTLSSLASCVEPEGDQSCYFTITANSSWTVTSDQDWCKIQTPTGRGNSIIYYEIAPNNSSKCRIAKITIKDQTGTRQHLVVQDMKNNPIGGYVCGVSAGTYISRMGMDILCPGFWTASINDTTWCKLENESGYSGDHCYITLDYNYTSRDKIAILTIKYDQYISYRIIVNYKIKESSQTKIPQIPMIEVEGGSFLLNNEKLVTLDSYYIGKYEVTQKQWFDVMGKKSSEFQGDDLPIEMISWNDAQEFIDKLNNLTDKKYRLPTEAEWEYAARGGNKSKGYAYSGSNAFKDVGWPVVKAQTTVFVGQKQPNELGIYDMTGNVGEFCSDWYSSPLIISNTHNPQGPSTGTEKVVKGWGWGGITTRSSFNPNGIYSNSVGFRLVLDK